MCNVYNINSIIFKNDTADSAFKDHKKEWEEITKDFEIET